MTPPPGERAALPHQEALMKGDGLGASGWAEEDEEEEDLGLVQ